MATNTNFSYAYEQDILISEQINFLLEQLPLFVSMYVKENRALEKYQPRTYLAYIREIYNFFQYMVKYIPTCDAADPEKITIEHLSLLTRDDLISYFSHITSYNVDGRKIKNGLSGKARKLASIGSLLSYLVRTGKLSHNVAKDISLAYKNEKDVVFMTTEEQNALLQAMDQGKVFTNQSLKKGNDSPKMRTYSPGHPLLLRDKAIVAMFLGTGIRVSELVGLNLDDVDFRASTICVTRKGGKQQVLSFSSDVEAYLLDYIDFSRRNLLKLEKGVDDNVEPALFVTQKKRRISVRAVEEMIQRYTSFALTSKVDKVTPHKLRSTYATNLLEESSDIYMVAEALGHSRVSEATKRYAKNLNMRAAAIDLRKSP